MVPSHQTDLELKERKKKSFMHIILKVGYYPLYYPLFAGVRASLPH